VIRREDRRKSERFVNSMNPDFSIEDVRKEIEGMQNSNKNIK